jgi:uncharacterized membrane protein HdeD (DUF308 family)
MANESSEDQKYRKKKSRTKIISLLLVISGILVLIAGISIVQTGFASFVDDTEPDDTEPDDTEPRIGLYIGGIFTIIGGVFLIIAGIFFFFDFKKKLIRRIAKIADAVEEERKQE